MKTRFWLAAVLAAGGASTFACGSDNSASEREPVGRGVPAASAGDEDPAPAGQRLSDSQIASVTTAANTGEIAQAKAALPRLTDTNTMQFAKMMVDMHSAAQQRQELMAQERGLTPEAHSLSTELAQDSDDVMEEMSTADRDDIDELYMEKQVEVHEKVLKTIDDILIPSATDPALQQELQKARTEVASHLQRAREIVHNLH